MRQPIRRSLPEPVRRLLGSAAPTTHDANRPAVRNGFLLAPGGSSPAAGSAGRWCFGDQEAQLPLCACRKNGFEWGNAQRSAGNANGTYGSGNRSAPGEGCDELGIPRLLTDRANWISFLDAVARRGMGVADAGRLPSDHSCTPW
jgi:hypothetical protein